MEGYLRETEEELSRSGGVFLLLVQLYGGLSTSAAAGDFAVVDLLLLVEW